MKNPWLLCWKSKRSSSASDSCLCRNGEPTASLSGQWHCEMAFRFSPIDGQLRYEQLWIKESTACLGRQMLPLQQMAFPACSGVRPTAHWIVSFPHELGYSPRAETAPYCNRLPHTGCSVLIIRKRRTQYLTWNLNGHSKNRQKIFQISSCVIG